MTCKTTLPQSVHFLLITACIVEGPNPDHCRNANGNPTCRELLGASVDWYCSDYTDECAPKAPFGCLLERPTDDCYSPCGGPPGQGELLCEEFADSGGSEAGDGDGDGDGSPGDGDGDGDGSPGDGDGDGDGSPGDGDGDGDGDPGDGGGDGDPQPPICQDVFVYIDVTGSIPVTSDPVDPWPDALEPPTLIVNKDCEAQLCNNPFVFCGSGLDDVLALSTTDDWSVCGNGGDDALIGGMGNDYLSGGADSDTVSGAAGEDLIDGGIGSDFINGGDQDDQLFGGNGDDTLIGGPGSDWLSGGDGNDVLHGGWQADRLLGGPGSDSLFGDASIDILEGGPDNDYLAGGSSSDTYIWRPGDGNDTIANETYGPNIIWLAGTSGADVTLLRVGCDLQIVLGSNKITVRDHYLTQADLIIEAELP